MPPENVGEIALACEGYRDLNKQTGIGEIASRAIMHVTKMTAEEFADHQRTRLQSLADKLAKKAESEVESLTPMQTVIGLGVVTDKINQGPKAVNQSLHLHIKGDAGSALSAILGPAAKSVFSAKPGQSSKEPNYIPGSGPTIETEATESA